MTVHRDTTMDEYSAIRRYFLTIDGPVTNLAMGETLADLLTTEFLTEGAEPAEMLDLHHAVLQLGEQCVKGTETN
ncbi:hypothetical protein ILFOPFJJ_01502 [Ensifer psoraleae]|uniref:hypothetical protein n=1 Tax=Sinorhizobium psoraleae TaxID=520838 RepID=UPI0015696B66|nr:hypothetical protein [Sinorhizobium psoraleae]NRP70621.1 hypothetical protein [Sinorhizobium psoraleae]